MASPDFSYGCMIALYPPSDVAQHLVLDGGLPLADLHVTVAYLGDAKDVDADAVRRAVAELAGRQPFTAHLAGIARFTGGDSDALVALVDSPDLEDLRRDTLNALSERGIHVPRDHGYTAHLTLTYVAPDDPAPLERLAPRDIEFTALSAVHGIDRTDVLLEHPMAGPAREAFAAGWAASGGPMTERVHAASRVAVQMAIESADDPDALKATIDLGKLEGMWALLFQRREEQQASQIKVIQAAWRALISRDAVAVTVGTLRRELDLTEADHNHPSLRAAALAAAQAMLHALRDLTGWTRLRDTLRDAIRAGRAEGMVNAVAVAAEQTGAIGLDWNIAFKDAYDSLRHLDDIWTDTDGWLAKTLDRATADLGRALADAAEQDLSREEMIDAGMEILTADRDAVAFVVDWAMTTAADQGALTLYANEGVGTADWITAGDARVCPTCSTNESGNPWRLTEFPPMPSHPVCRCVPAAAVDLAHFATWFT